MTAPPLFAHGDTEAWLDALRRASAEDVLLPVLIQLAIIILVARVFAFLFRRFGQPSVVGEIAAGIVLGPSVFGLIAPEMAAGIFHPAVHGLPPELADATLHWIFTTLSHIGLILLLFLVGLEFDFSHLQGRRGSSLAISLAGVALPFTLGLVIGWTLWPHLEPRPDTGRPVPLLGFVLLLGTALSITALPVLGRMMQELGITRTRLGAITISAAALDDAIGWILLAAVAAVARGRFEALASIRMIAETAAFAFAMLLVAGPLLRRWVRRAVAERGGELDRISLAVLLALVFAAAIVTNKIGIFAIFGAFLLGAVLSPERAACEAISRRLSDFVTAFFVPIFFTYTGLRTNIGALGSETMWLFAGLVLAAAIAGKLGGCGLAARLTGFSGREAACIGAMMNTRGLMELVVVNVGYDLGVIPPSVYCMLVLMALATTVMTTPLLLRLARGTELSGPLEAAGFLRAAKRSGDSSGTIQRD